VLCRHFFASRDERERPTAESETSTLAMDRRGVAVDRDARGVVVLAAGRFEVCWHLDDELRKSQTLARACAPILQERNGPDAFGLLSTGMAILLAIR